MSESNVYPLQPKIGKQPPPEPIEPRIKLFSDFYGKTPEPPEYIVEQLIPKRRATLFAGRAGYGKTYACQMLMAATSGGKDWFGLSVRKCRSFGFFSEDPDEEIHRRIIPISEHYDIDVRDFDDWASYIPNDDGNFELFICPRAYDPGLPRTRWTQIEQRCADDGVELIVLDNILNIFQGNMLNRTHANSCMRWFNAAARRLNCGIVILCNPPKPSKDNKKDDPYFSGTQVWEDAARSTLSLNAAIDDQDKEIEGEFVLRVMKNNYISYNHPLKRKGITLEWQNNVLVRKPVANQAILSEMDRLELESRMLKAVKHFVGVLGHKCAADPGSPNYLPDKLANQARWQDVRWIDLVSACDRLLTDGRLIKVATANGRDAWLIRTPDCQPYLGERE
jgi:RecA-family ATPase